MRAVRISPPQEELIQTNFTDWLMDYLDGYYEWLALNESIITPADTIELHAAEYTLRQWNMLDFHPALP